MDRGSDDASQRETIAAEPAALRSDGAVTPGSGDPGPPDRTLATPRSWGDLLALFEPAGSGLAASHAAGLVHRDVEPGNIVVVDQFNDCVALWEALVGEHPFDRTSTLTLAQSVTTVDPRGGTRGPRARGDGRGGARATAGAAGRGRARVMAVRPDAAIAGRRDRNPARAHSGIDAPDPVAPVRRVVDRL